MKCLACSKELNRKEVVYTEDKKPYCQNPFQCNDSHPNSVNNILARGGAVKLYSEEKLEENIFERLSISEEMKDRILKVATKPQSIRLSKYEIAHYLLTLQDSMNLSSISEAVRYCVTSTMKAKPLSSIVVEPKEEAAPVVEPTELAQKAIKLGSEPVVIPDIPKSVNVDWSKVERAATEEEKVEEDEFTF